MGWCVEVVVLVWVIVFVECGEMKVCVVVFGMCIV